MTGVVVKTTGSWVTVRLSEDSGGATTVDCKVRGTLRQRGLRCTNPVAVGDIVTVQAADSTPMVSAVEPRRNYIIRRASNLSKEFQIIAANVDQAVLVATLATPLTSTTFIDRFLATAQAYRVPALLAINKIDLLAGDDDQQLLEAVRHLYETIGYPVVALSTVTGEGLDDLRHALNGKLSLLAGNSGVGKSSIINSLVPDAALRVGDVSQAHHKGMHTTTFSQMIDLPDGGAIIDSPGVKAWGVIDFERSEAGHYFPEIFAASRECRFTNCTHTHEPGCAVIDAVQNGYIAQSRYASYISILDEDPHDKYRKGH